jgi:hypothetical protein
MICKIAYGINPVNATYAVLGDFGGKNMKT